MTKKIFGLLFLSAFGALNLAACGGAEVGEECDTSGNTDECVDNAVCGDSGDGTGVFKCLKVCSVQEDCAADEECNGVSGGSLKGCRPKTK